MRKNKRAERRTGRHDADSDSLFQQDSRWQQSFDYEKVQGAQAYQRWLEEFTYGKAQDAIDNAYRQSVFDYQRNSSGGSSGRACW